MGTVTLAAHTIVKQIIDFCLGLLGTFSTVSQTLIASCLGKVDPATTCSTSFPSLPLECAPLGLLIANHIEQYNGETSMGNTVSPILHSCQVVSDNQGSEQPTNSHVDFPSEDFIPRSSSKIFVVIQTLAPELLHRNRPQAKYLQMYQFG